MRARPLLRVLGLEKVIVLFGLVIAARPAVASLGWATAEAVVRAEPGAGVAVFEFPFRNEGPTPVGIASVMAGCKCVSADSDKRAYAVGEVGMVRAQFALAGRSGRNEVVIQVTTDDAPDHPTMLKAIVDIPVPIAITPMALFWRVGDAADEKEIAVNIAKPTTATLGDVQNAEPAFSARLVALDAEQGRYCVRVKPAMTGKAVQATLRLGATVDGRPQVFVLQAGVRE